MKSNPVIKIEYSGKEPVSTRANYKKKDRIVDPGFPVDPMGYWNPANIGHIVQVPTDDGHITMKGVNQPLIGMDEHGNTQYQIPGQEYHYQGKFITEYPITKNGGWLDIAQDGKEVKLKNIKQLYNPLNERYTKLLEDPEAYKKNGEKNLLFLADWLMRVNDTEDLTERNPHPYTQQIKDMQLKLISTPNDELSNFIQNADLNQKGLGQLKNLPYIPKSWNKADVFKYMNYFKQNKDKGYTYQDGGWLDTMQDGGTKPWGEMTPKERAAYLDAKEANKKAETKSRAQAKKEHINDYIINSTKEALTHPMFSAPAYLTPQGAMIGAGQAAINASKNIYEGNYKTAAFDALGVLPLLKQLKNIPKSIKKVPVDLPGSPTAPKGKMYGENQVLTQQSRLLDPKIKAKFFEHQAPEIEAKIQYNILGEKLWKAPKDYGNRITPENYEEFVKKIHGSTEYDLAANSGRSSTTLGLGDYGKPGMVYSDAPLNNLGKDIVNAHEKNHGMFVGTLSKEMSQDLLKPFGTNKPVPFYGAKAQPDEVLARMAQFKNAIGMSDNQPFTLGHLNLIRKNYANSFLDNGITEMLNKIKPGSSGEKHFLNNMNKYAFGVGAPAAIGVSALQEEEDGGFLDDEYRRGGQKGLKKFTSKNIQSSVNDIMMRNVTLFGPPGKRRYKPGLKFEEGGEWLDNIV